MSASEAGLFNQAKSLPGPVEGDSGWFPTLYQTGSSSPGMEHSCPLLSALSKPCSHLPVRCLSWGFILSQLLRVACHSVQSTRSIYTFDCSQRGGGGGGPVLEGMIIRASYGQQRVLKKTDWNVMCCWRSRSLPCVRGNGAQGLSFVEHTA